MKTTKVNNNEIAEKTKADQLVEVANWVKRQNPEFTKNFQSMRSIIKFYLELPNCYDKKKSVVAFINKNLSKDSKKWDSWVAHQAAERLSLIANTLFEFRYFEKAPYKWVLEFYIRRYPSRIREQIEVACTTCDRCNIYSDFKQIRNGTCSITIKTLGDAKRAVERLMESETRKKGNDYEINYSNSLMEAMKQSETTKEELQVQHDIVF